MPVRSLEIITLVTSSGYRGPNDIVIEQHFLGVLTKRVGVFFSESSSRLPTW